jgi:hypothetical protein
MSSSDRSTEYRPGEVPFRFPPGVAERIGSYVYVLIDPRPSPPRPFYVGKGVGNRVFAHAHDAIRTPSNSDKLETIRSIHSEGRSVVVQIVRHGLDDATALAVEAACIDLVREHVNPDAGNAVRGHGHEYGLIDLDFLVERYAAQPLTITEPSILIRIATHWRRGMRPDEVYEATRRRWKLAPSRAKRAKYAVAVADGIVRAVYEGMEWTRASSVEKKDVGRWEFAARPAVTRAEWIGRSVVGHFALGAQNPIRYVNC